MTDERAEIIERHKGRRCYHYYDSSRNKHWH